MKLSGLSSLCDEMRACRICAHQGILPEARPIFQLSTAAPIAVFGQAPGNLAHQVGLPFKDPSGDRLRAWMGVTSEEFYDPQKLAILPMAFCFPGYDGKGPTGKGGDLPPPPLCAQTWRPQVMTLLEPQLKLVLLIGQYAQNWHLPEAKKQNLTQRVADWRHHIARAKEGNSPTIYLPLPHPSWRNNGWLKKNPWFEQDVLPWMQQAIRDYI